MGITKFYLVSNTHVLFAIKYIYNVRIYVYNIQVNGKIEKSVDNDVRKRTGRECND